MVEEKVVEEEVKRPKEVMRRMRGIEDSDPS
jgi:hypothetical protein